MDVEITLEFFANIHICIHNFYKDYQEITYILKLFSLLKRGGFKQSKSSLGEALRRFSKQNDQIQSQIQNCDIIKIINFN